MGNLISWVILTSDQVDFSNVSVSYLKALLTSAYSLSRHLRPECIQSSSALPFWLIAKVGSNWTRSWPKLQVAKADLFQTEIHPSLPRFKTYFGGNKLVNSETNCLVKFVCSNCCILLQFVATPVQNILLMSGSNISSQRKRGFLIFVQRDSFF